MRDHITLTREQLHELVWQKPMSSLAADHAISDVGLKKLCARHKIPTPPRGYWAMLAAGTAPTRPPLPKTAGSALISLRVATSDDNNIELRDELALAIAAEKQPENRVVVADRLHAPSALVREAKTAFQEVEEDHVGILKRPAGYLDLRVSRAQLERALRIWDALLKSFERRGWEVAVHDDGTFVHVGEAPVSLTVEESITSVERPLKQPPASSSYVFHYNRRETVRRPSRELSISIQEHDRLWGYSQRRTWRDSGKRVLEEQLNQIVVGMLKLGAAMMADRARRERQQQQAAERKRKIQEALDEQGRLRAALAKERANVERLLQQAARWRESQHVRLFLRHAKEQGGVPEMKLDGQAFVEWHQWALQQADRLDPFMASPPSILDEAERIEHMCDGLRDP